MKSETSTSQYRPRTKKELIYWWSKLKDISSRYNTEDDKFGCLFFDACKLIDTSDLDYWIENYDFNKKGNQEYHQIMGKKFLGWDKLSEINYKNRNLDEDHEVYPERVDELHAMEKMAHQVLARCYIEMNRLVHGKDEDWEAEMNWISRNWMVKSLQSTFEEKLTSKEIKELPQLMRKEIARREENISQISRIIETPPILR